MTAEEAPSFDDLTICFAHPAYRMAAAFARRQTGIEHFQVWTPAELLAAVSQADVLVVSGLWHDGLLPDAGRLRYIQSISAGTDQYPLPTLQRKGIRLASASGVNRHAVAEHALAHMLALARHIHTGRDHQQRHFWRHMISDPAEREDELRGKTVLIIGLGQIGSRLGQLARAFGMHILAIKRHPETGAEAADLVAGPAALPQLLPQADYVVLTCHLTPETTHLINHDALSRMRRTAHLVNMARGLCVDEAALIASLRAGRIAGAGLDSFAQEPLPADSPLWDMKQVLITPHTAGETRRYEEGVVDILLENLQRLARGETLLRNQVV